MKYLEIGPHFRLPANEAVTQSIVIYGNRGMGKTNLAAVLAEEFQRAAIRFSLLDPVGVSYGLRHSADGKGKGIDLLILGGRHGDLPIEPTGGAVVADLVVDEHVDTVVDISGEANGRRWSHDAKVRFAADYFERLLERQGEQRRPIMQMVDEAARFAPQVIELKDPTIVRCKGALNTIVEEGRNSAIGLTLITQRSARMAKSVSELAELMLAFRTTGPNSIGAILEWFGEHVEKSRWNDLLAVLRKLPVGQALAVSPGWLDYEGTVQVRMRRTFDSSKTPTGTEQKLARAHKRPDLDTYRERLAETVQKAEASDPVKLRARVDAANRAAEKTRGELVRALNQIEEFKVRQAAEKGTPRASAAADQKAEKITSVKQDLARYRRALEEAVKILVRIKAIEFDTTNDQDRVALEQAIAAAVRHVTEPIEKRVTALAGRVEGIRTAAGAAQQAIGALLSEKIDITVQVEKREPFAVRPASAGPARALREPRTIALDGESRIMNADGSLRKHAAGLLTALAQQARPLTRTQLHIHAGYAPSGDTSTAIAEMHARGWIAVLADGRVAITATGHTTLGHVDPLPTGAALRDHVLNGTGKLSSAERKLLGTVFEAHPTALTRADLHARAGLKPSGDTSTAIAKFLKLGWLEQEGRALVASWEFFA